MTGALKPRASPAAVVKTPKALRMLVYDVYPQLKDRAEIMFCIETHLALLLSQGRVRDAIAFLRESEIGLRHELLRRPIEKRRGVLKVVGSGTLSASLGILVKYVASKLGVA